MTRKLFSLFLFFLALSFVPSVGVKAGPSTKFVSFLLVLDQGSGYEELDSWLSGVGFNNFAFAVCGVLDAENYWLGNSTRLSTLKNYGKLIPVALYLASMSPCERMAIVDDVISTWISKVGYSPKGFFDFQPDTYTVNYLEQRNVSYVVGYCFDQYAIDWMTERGGWQLPYYAHHNNALRPNDVESHGIVVFPHLCWDWSASFTATHMLCTHPLALKNIFDGNMTTSGIYFRDLIDADLEACEPLGLVSVQFEWVWAGINGGIKDYAKNWIRNLLATRSAKFWNYEDIVTWFNANCASTPAYSVNFVSPYSNERIEWYYCQKFRIARVNGNIVSYVEYNAQMDDVFLASSFEPNFFSASVPDNCIDTSLNFTIDVLGGGKYRSPVVNTPYPFGGKLSEFPQYYQTRNLEDAYLLPYLFAFLAFLGATVVFLYMRPTTMRHATIETLGVAFSKAKRSLMRNPLMILFLVFVALLLTCAALLIHGDLALANTVALCAYGLLVTEVSLQLIFLLTHRERDST
jgi:hypothetical protein